MSNEEQNLINSFSDQTLDLINIGRLAYISPEMALKSLSVQLCNRYISPEIHIGKSVLKNNMFSYAFRKEIDKYFQHSFNS